MFLLKKLFSLLTLRKEIKGLTSALNIEGDENVLSRSQGGIFKKIKDKKKKIKVMEIFQHIKKM